MYKLSLAAALLIGAKAVNTEAQSKVKQVAAAQIDYLSALDHIPDVDPVAQQNTLDHWIAEGNEKCKQLFEELIHIRTTITTQIDEYKKKITEYEEFCGCPDPERPYCKRAQKCLPKKDCCELDEGKHFCPFYADPDNCTEVEIPCCEPPEKLCEHEYANEQFNVCLPECCDHYCPFTADPCADEDTCCRADPSKHICGGPGQIDACIDKHVPEDNEYPECCDEPNEFYWCSRTTDCRTLADCCEEGTTWCGNECKPNGT